MYLSPWELDFNENGWNEFPSTELSNYQFCQNLAKKFEKFGQSNEFAAEF